MPDDGSTGSGGVAEAVSMLPGDEEVNEGEAVVIFTSIPFSSRFIYCS